MPLQSGSGEQAGAPPVPLCLSRSSASLVRLLCRSSPSSQRNTRSQEPHSPSQGMWGWSHLVRGALLVSCLTRFPVVLPFSVTAGRNREDKRGEILLIGCPGSFSVLPEGIWGGGGCLS